VWLRYRRLPKRITDHKLESVPRAVVEVETINLQRTDADTLKGHIQRLHAFYLGLKFPVQIVVRTWHSGLIERRWFIAVSADTDEVLATRLEDVIAALKRAGLDGRALNGDLYDTLNACWSVNQLGPRVIERERHHVVVDGEYVRGFLLTKFPRIVEPNWLHSVLDGELPCDFSLWLEPLDNVQELDYLANFIVERQQAQISYFRDYGYEDPDLKDEINDAARTRIHLRQRRLKVFKGTAGFVVRGPDLATCLQRESLLVDQLREHVGADAVIPLDYEHDKAVLLAVPTATAAVEYPLQMVSPVLAMSYPFSNSSVSMTDGVDCGTSIGSNRVNRLNLFTRPNPHMVIPGGSGSGKGYWTKVWLWRLMHAYPWKRQVNVFIIQSEKDEYTSLAEAMNLPVLTFRSLEEIEAALYRHSGAFRSTAQLLVCDVLQVPDKGKAIARLVKAVDDTVAHRHRPRQYLMVLDELGIVLKERSAAAAIETAYRRFRSIPWSDNAKEVNRCGVIGLTQLPSDLLGDQRGKVLLSLADTRLYLRQQPDELNATKNLLKLSVDEQALLEGAEPGDALLVAGKARIPLHVHATAQEHEFAKT
jgi:hypothetical protein